MYQAGTIIAYEFAALYRAYGFCEKVMTNAKNIEESQNDGFPTGTEIHIDGGRLDISDIKVGYHVLAKNLETGEVALKKVTRVFEHGERPLLSFIYVPVKNDLDRQEILKCVDKAGIDGISRFWYEFGTFKVTEQHPIWITNKGWTPAKDIKQGDCFELCYNFPNDWVLEAELAALEDRLNTAKMGVVVLIEAAEPDEVYNIEVEDFHTYFVDTFGVLVHNKNSQTAFNASKHVGTP